MRLMAGPFVRPAFILTIAFVAIAALASLWLAPGAAQASGSTLFVSTTGSDAGPNDCLNGLAPCLTITHAISQATAGDTIMVLAGTLSESSVTVDKDLTIRGAGAATTTVDAASAGRVFTITSGASVTIDALTVTGGSTSDGGGGILSEGTLTLTNSMVTGNVTNASGAGISSSGTLTVIASTIFDNTASSHGGGIHITGGTAAVINSTISGNNAGDHGGGVTLNHGVSLVAVNSTIYGNTAGTGGGMSSFGGLTLRNTIVAGNTANDFPDIAYTLEAASSNNLIGDAGSAGGLTDGVNGNIVGADVADVLNTTLADHGGPTLTHALVPGSPAINAGADTSGDGVTADQRGIARPQWSAYDIGAFEYVPGPVINEDTGLDYATLQEAIDDADPGDTLLVAAGTLTEHSLAIDFELNIIGAGSGATTINAGGLGRVFDIGASGEVTITGLTITGGSVSNPDTGGGIRNQGDLTITDAIITGNSAWHGGGIRNEGTLHLTDVTVSNNNAGEHGAGIRNDGVVIMQGGTLTANTAAGNAGGIFNTSGGDVTFDDVSISGNTATVDGGGVYNGGGATTAIAGGSLNGNHANRGGGISIGSGTVTIGGLGAGEGVSIIGNTSAIGGGAIHNESITAATAVGNWWGDLSGPGGVGPGSGDTISTNVTYDPWYRDAGMTVLSTSPTITNTDTAEVFLSLQAAINDADTLNGHTLELSAGTLTQYSMMVNKALTIIGAGAGSTTTIDADGGGPVFRIAPGASVTIDSLTITGGIGFVTDFGQEGGGIYNEGALTVTNTIFTNNSAFFGGGISNLGVLTVSDSAFTGNSADFGGGIYNWTTAEVTNSTFTGNTADFGGAIFNGGDVGAALAVTNSTISSNSADLGGGIFNSFESITVTNTTVSGNTASSNGGGFFNDFGSATVTNSTISGNSASGNGGGIYQSPSSSTTVTNSAITGNSAVGSGDGIYLAGGTVTATHNWWGDATGPGEAGPGTGDGVSANVAFEPWYTDAGMTTLSAPQEVWVDNDWTGQGDLTGGFSGLTWEYDAFDSIQDAIAAVADGGTVHVLAGTYNEQGMPVNKDVSVLGAGAASTIVQGNSTAPMFVIAGDHAVRMEGLTITGGSTTYFGGGLYIHQASVTLDGLIVRENVATNDGNGAGGIYVEAATVTIRDSRIEENGTAGWGGGLYLRDGATVLLADGVVIATNTAEWGAGGIYVGGGSVLSMDGGAISGNRGLDEFSTGGGLFATDNGTSIVLTGGVSIDGNQATYGGGVSLSLGVNFDMTGGAISWNSVLGGGDDGLGGGLFANGNANAALSGVVVEGNSADEGEGIYSDSVVTITATQNFWGSLRGPSHASNTADGTGQSISGTATFSPWYADDTFTLLYGIATQLRFATQPGDAGAGELLSPQPGVRAEDADGHLGINFTGPVTLTLNPSTGTLDGTTTVDAVDGLVTFAGLAVRTVGTFTLTAASAPLTGTASADFTITAGPPATLTVDTQPANAFMGGAILGDGGGYPAALLTDAYGNPVEGVAVTVALRQGGGASAFGAGSITTATTGADGIAVFTQLMAPDAGSGYSLRFTAGALEAESDAFAISVITVDNTGTCSDATATTDSTVPFCTVQAAITYVDDEDLEGPDTTIWVMGGGAEYVENLAFDIDISLVGVNSPWLRASDTGDSVVVINGGPVVTMEGFTITGADHDGNGGGIWLSNSTLTLVDVVIIANMAELGGGVYVSGGTLTVDGGQISSNSALVDGGGIYNNGGVVRLLGADLSDNAASGDGGGIYVSSTGSLFVEDTTIWGNVADRGGAIYTDSGDVEITLSSFSGNTATTTGDAIFNTGGTLDLERNWWDALGGPTHADNNGGEAYGQDIIGAADFSPWCATSACEEPDFHELSVRLAFQVQPSTATVEQAIDPAVVVWIVGTEGYRAINATASVDMTLAGATTTLDGTLPVLAADGVATFSDLSISVPGTGYTLTAEDADSVLASSAASNAFDVLLLPEALAVTGQPAVSSQAGQTLGTVTVQLRNQHGTDVPQAGVNVGVTLLNANGAVLTGTITRTTNSSGVATFDDLFVDLVGTGYQLRFTSSGLSNATSNGFSITPGAPAALAVVTQPRGGIVGQLLQVQPVIEVLDAFGNRVTTDDTTEVTLAISRFVVSAQLQGVRTVRAVEGVAHSWDYVSPRRAKVGGWQRRRTGSTPWKRICSRSRRTQTAKVSLTRLGRSRRQ